ncbi:MAG TPA: hypothetical protein VIV60_34875, partial [Polyangiaceae bacterium]
MEPSVAGRTSIVLVVGDSEAVHDAFRDALCRPLNPGVPAVTTISKRTAPDHVTMSDRFEVSFALQTSTAVDALRRLEVALAFVELRDVDATLALNTVRALWAVKPTLDIVLCGSHFDEAVFHPTNLGDRRDHLVLLRRPFTALEVRQLVYVLTGSARVAQAPRVRELGASEFDDPFAHAEQLKLLVDNASDFLYQRTESGHMLYISPG